MKLQNMTVIFAIIIIPVTLILSAYIGTQIDTAVLQQTYSTKLMDATHDAVVAFQLNTANNAYSSNADSIRRDIKASVNTFSTSLATSLGLPGSNSSYIMPYVPALVFTMYDGYYIYSPNEYTYLENGENKTGYQHILKPYIHYSVRYVNGSTDLVINYSIDNYITIYGNIAGKGYISKSGYLIDTNKVKVNRDNVTIDNTIRIEKESLKEVVAIKEGENVLYNEYIFKYINNQKVYQEDSGKWFTLNNLAKMYVNVDDDKQDESAIKYYKEAYEFTKWLLEEPIILDTVRPQNAIKSDGTKYKEFQNNNKQILNVNSNNNPEDRISEFNQHKRETMKISIQENLNNAIAIYDAHSEKSANFAMPILTDLDWEKLLTNVNIISFMQGLPVGNNIYNNYVIVTSTENKQYINPEFIYFTDNTDTYHKINCPNISENNLIGYKSLDFKIVNNKEDGTKYYYKHPEYADYNCIINPLNEDLDISKLKNDNIKKAYYSALARERYNLDKVTKMLEDKL